MKVELAASAGFCVGVQRAIDMALEHAGKNEELFMLGDIVHNDSVVELFKKKGVKKIKKLGRGAGRNLLIRAHGAPLSVYAAARKAGYKIIDATCPMVKEIHEAARADEKKGRIVVLIGDEKHEEVLGIKGSLSKPPILIDPSKPLPVRKLKQLKKVSIIVQSTQNSEKVSAIVSKISAIVPDVAFHDTICVPTKNRQKEAKVLPLRNDAMVVVGSGSSANTKRLYEISANLNKRTYIINSTRDIDPGIFRGVRKVGVLAGASTPDSIIKQVVSFLRSIDP